MFPLKNTEAYIHANGYRSTLGKELAARDAEISEVKSEIQALTNRVNGNWSEGGKNLFDPSAYSSYKQSDGSYRLTGSQANAIRVNVPKSLVGVECTASIYLDLSKESAPTQVYICATVSGTTSYGNRISANSEGVTKITFTPQSVSDTIGLTFGSEGSNYFTMTDLQLEKGTEVTEYVPYAKTNVELTQLGVYYNTSNDSISLPTGTEPEIINISNLPAGVYIVSAMVRGYPNTECDKYARVLSSNDSNIARIQGVSKIEDISISAVVNIPVNNGTISIKAYQNSGSTVTLNARLDIVRVG